MLPTLSFGFSPDADFRISDFSHDARGSVFTLTHGEQSFRLRLPFPGEHNALNAAAAIVAVCALCHDFTTVCATLCEVAALPARRFERVGNPRDFTVISDYAHHPVEIKALVGAAKTLPDAKRLLAVFEPHRYTRTKAFIADFPSAFDGVDVLVLCPVYAAGEQAIAGGTTEDLYAQGRATASRLAVRPEIILSRSLDDAQRYVQSILREGDAVLCVGAGNIDKIALPISNSAIPQFRNSAILNIANSQFPNSPIPQFSKIGSYGVEAHVPQGLTVVKSVEELREIVAGGNYHVIGAGTNTLISPTGYFGKLVRLESGNGILPLSTARCRCHTSAPGSKLLAYCREHGLSGLEFMAGIPGLCGGWLAMNAGTGQGCFCDAVVSVTAMDSAGEIVTLTKNDLRASYRSCPGLKGHVALEIELQLTQSTPEFVAALLRNAQEKRFDFAGMRTAGSVFKNPPGDKTAGQILDAAGCRGLRVGGAYVCERHANIIAADDGATASDVLALIGIMRRRALDASGAALELELEIV